MTATTSTPSAVAAAPPEDPIYPSLAALRLAHHNLLRGFERSNPSPEVLRGVEDFLAAGRQTGAVLPDEEQRSAAQSVLDYWSAVLYRAKRQPPDATLVPFNPPARLATVGCPYPGLAPFDATERDFFLGREAVVDELVAKLTSRRLLVVTGPRGCGKSSLVRAGLLPALQAGALPGSDRWCYLGPLVPGPQPLESLALALRTGQDARDTPSAAALRADAGCLANAVRGLGPALLFVDQLEDVLPAPGEVLDADRAAFVNSLVTLVNAADVACVLVVTRTDEAIDTAFHAADDLLAEAARADVPEFGTRELRDAIQRPAELVGVTFDDEVVADLVRALVGVPVAPPLLQFVLAALWESRRGQVITWDAYRSLMWDPRRRRANAGWAIGHAAQARYDQLASDPLAQAAFKDILLQLVVPVEGSDVVLRRLRVSDVRRGSSAAPESFDRALGELLDGRLLRSSGTAAGDATDPSVEVVHAALARNWPTLDRWLIEVRIEQERRRRLQAATREWLDHGRSEDALWREALLEGLDEHDPALGTAEHEFIAESQLAVRRHERRRVRNQRLGSLVAVVLVVLAGLVAVLALKETFVARSHQLLADMLVADNPAAALLMAVSATQFDPGVDSRVGVLDQLERHRQLVGILGASGQLTASAASSDGAYLAGAETVTVGGPHSDVVLWNGVSLAELSRLDMRKLGDAVQGHSVRALAFDANHARLAVAFDNNAVSIWDPRTEEPIRWRPDPNQPDQLLLTGRDQPLTALAFDVRDGHDWLVTIGQDGLVSWDVQTGAIALQARIAQRPVVALSPDGTRVAAVGCGAYEVAPACSSPRTLRLWDTATAGLVWTGQTGGTVTGLWFSQASDAIAAANQDGTVEVRDAGAPDSVRPPIATGSVVRLAVDSHAGLLVTATCKLSLGGTCSPDGDAHVQTFDLQRSAAAGPPLVVSPDGVPGLQLLAPAAVPSNDAGPALRIFLPRASEITVLDMQNDRVGPDPVAVADALGGLGPGVVRVGPERVAALGCVLAGQGAACPAGTLHLADARTGAAIGQNLVGEPPAGVSSLAATADGGSLAAGRVDGRIDVWDLSTGVRRPGLPPMDSGGRISGLAFAADGRLAAAAPGRLRVWTLDNPQAPRSVDLSTTNAQTSVLAFSPDAPAAMLGSGGSDGNLEAWQVAAGASPTVRIYRGHTAAITSIAFSPDKRLIAAAAGNNQKVLVWDLESARLIGEPLLASSLAGPVATLAFSPDSQTLTAGDGQSLAAWRLDLSSATDPVRRACQIAHRNLKADEWHNLALDAPFWTVGCPEWPA